MVDPRENPAKSALDAGAMASIEATGRTHMRVSVLLLVTMLLAVAAISGLAHFQPILQWMERRQLATWQGQNALYAHHVEFADADDRLLLHDLPRAEFRHGGVYFIGSSTMQFAMATWLMPADERRRIHNLALKSANYSEQFRWVRYLVEHKGLLKAGAGRNLVVLGLSHLDARPKLPGTIDWNYIPALFERHGLHTYGADGTIGDALPEPLAWLQRERMRSYHFLRSIWTHRALPVRPQFHDPGIGPVEAARARAVFRQTMGGDAWPIHMDRQLMQLQHMIRYLKERGALVEAVMIPLASWNRGFEVAEAFDARVKETLRTEDVPVKDLQWECPDGQFFDMTHLNARGQQAITPVLARIGAGFLATRQ